jgi:hypothetical protein
MTTLRVPSVQHLARNWGSDPAFIAKNLVTLVLSPPRFNYSPLYGAVRDMLLLGVPYDHVLLGIGRIKQEGVRRNLSDVMPLIRDHFASISPDFYQIIEKRYYPVGRGLMVPFEPPMIYGIGGQLYFPWFSFWRRNPLAKERLSLFVTLVDELLMQDPDLEKARFEILDFSCPGPKSSRELRVIDAHTIPRVDRVRKFAMLETFAEGYYQAVAKLSEKPSRAEADNSEDTTQGNSGQPNLFD